MNPRVAKIHLQHRVLLLIVGEVLEYHSLPQEWAFMQLKELLVITHGHLNSWNRYHILFIHLNPVHPPPQSPWKHLQPNSVCADSRWNMFKGAISSSCHLFVKAPGKGRSGECASGFLTLLSYFKCEVQLTYRLNIFNFF